MASLTKTDVVLEYVTDSTPVRTYSIRLGDDKRKHDVLVVSKADQEELISLSNSKTTSVKLIRPLSCKEKNKGAQLAARVLSSNGKPILVVAFKKSLVLYSLKRKFGDVVVGRELSNAPLKHKVIGIEASSEGTMLGLHESTALALFRVARVDKRLELIFLERVNGITTPLGCIRFSCINSELLFSVENDVNGLRIGQIEVTARGVVRTDRQFPLSDAKLKFAAFSSRDEVAILLQDDRVLRIGVAQKDVRTDVRLVPGADCIGWDRSEDAIIVVACGESCVVRFHLFDLALNLLEERTLTLGSKPIMICQFFNDVAQLKEKAERFQQRIRRSQSELTNFSSFTFFCCIGESGQTTIVRLSSIACVRRILENYILRSQLEQGLSFLERILAVDRLVPAVALFIRRSMICLGRDVCLNCKISDCCLRGLTQALMPISLRVTPICSKQKSRIQSCTRKLLSRLLLTDHLPEALTFAAQAKISSKTNDIASTASMCAEQFMLALGKRARVSSEPSVSAFNLPINTARANGSKELDTDWPDHGYGSKSVNSAEQSNTTIQESVQCASPAEHTHASFNQALRCHEIGFTSAEPMEKASAELSDLWLRWRNVDTVVAYTSEERSDSEDSSKGSTTMVSIQSGYRLGLWLELRGDMRHAHTVYSENGLQREKERLLRAVMATDPLSSKDLFPHSCHVMARRRSDMMI